MKPIRVKINCILCYFILCGILPNLAIGQIKTLPELLEKYNIPVKDGEIVYEIIDSTYPGKTKEEIFVAAQSTLVQKFKDSKAVLEVADKNAGHLMGKGNVVFEFVGTIQVVGIRVPFIIDIQIKTGKYRVQFKSISSYYDPREEGKADADGKIPFIRLTEKNKNYQQKFMVGMNNQMKALCIDFRDEINKKLAGKDDF